MRAPSGPYSELRGASTSLMVPWFLWTVVRFNMLQSKNGHRQQQREQQQQQAAGHRRQMPQEHLQVPISFRAPSSWLLLAPSGSSWLLLARLGPSWLFLIPGLLLSPLALLSPWASSWLLLTPEFP